MFCICLRQTGVCKHRYKILLYRTVSRLLLRQRSGRMVFSEPGRRGAVAAYDLHRTNMSNNTPRKQLRGNALGLIHAVAIGVAGTAPSYSIAASTAALIGAVGALAPASLLYCGLIMIGIALAFVNLNRVYPDSGASYAWVGRVFNRDLGFLTGWAVLVASALFMVSVTIPASTATLMMLAPDLADQQHWVIAVSIAWLLLISGMVVRGTQLTGRIQTVMTATEIVVLLSLTISAIWQFGPQLLGHLSWSAISPQAFSLESFASGAVVALFFFWGWDVTLNVSEETRDSARTPGIAAGLAMLVILCAFMGFVTVTLVVLTQPEIEASGANVVFAVAEKLFPRPWSYLAVLAVMLSSVGTLGTAVLLFGRTLFAKSRAGEMHARWSRVHPIWDTPHLATYLIAVIGVLLLILSLGFPSVDAVMKASINAIGLEIALYYGMAGLACAWHFRHQARRHWRVALLAVLWPLMSVLVLWTAAAMAAMGMDGITLAIGLGGIAVGVVPLMLFRGRRLPHD